MAVNDETPTFIFSKNEDLDDQLALSKTSSFISDAYKNLVNQQEAYLRQFIHSRGLSLDDFVRNWVVEYHPLAFTPTTDSRIEDEVIYQVRQTIRIRPKDRNDR